MIGNDIVDLDLARRESNWKRKGFLNKIYAPQEQALILKDANPELLLWNLWTRKEPSYKIYNRITGIRGYFPSRLRCHYENQNSGTVSIDGFVFYTQTQITDTYVYSIAVAEMAVFKMIKPLQSMENIVKENGIPSILNPDSKLITPVSITHHGRFQRVISV